MTLIHLEQNSTASELNEICILVSQLYTKNNQLSNSSINWVYIHFDQKDINNQPKKEQKNVDDRVEWLIIAKSLVTESAEH